MRLRDEKGYSLVEVLIVIAILAVVGGLICSILLSSTTLFSRSKDEADVQSEAQTTINWLNDMLAEAGYGVTYMEDTSSHVLDIYNESNYYKITYDLAGGKLYCEEREFQNDGTFVVLTAKQLLAEYVTDFSVNTSALTEKNPVVVLTLNMKKGERNVSLVRNVTLRNGVAINQTIDKVYEGKVTIASSVEDVTVYPVQSFQAKGTDVQFTARVTGVGFPSQMVTWSIADRTGLKDGTAIDERTGVLHIDENETQSAFVVKATSMDTDTEGNRVSSIATSGIVKVMTINSVQITNAPAEKQAVGSVLSLNALVHGENMDEAGSGVIWSIPAAYRKEGVSVGADGTVVLGMALYNAFPTDAEKSVARIAVRATSVADASKYAECYILLSFPDMGVDLENLTYSADRNSYIDLSAKLNTLGVVNSSMNYVWSMESDAGLGAKVSLDTGLGTLSVAKDIDYNTEYVVKVKVSAISAGTHEVAASYVMSIVIPKVTISLETASTNVVKGNSVRIPYVISGLRATESDVQATSVPAVRNTLLYVQGEELVVSVGRNIDAEAFTVKLSLAGYSNIAASCAIQVVNMATSDDELAAIINVQDVYLHVPVPGVEGRAPSLNEVKLGGATREISGHTINYSYDWTNSRCNIQIGTDTAVYYYQEVDGSDIVWYRQ